MKRNVLLILLIASMMILTGCAVKMDVGLVVDKDRNVTMSIISAMDNELIDASISMQEQSAEGATETQEGDAAQEPKVYTDEERWKYVEESAQEDEDYKEYQKERYEEGEFKGYKYTRSLGNLDEVTEEATAGSIPYDELTERNKFFTRDGKVLSLHIDMDREEGDLAEADSYKEQGIDMLINFSITLPKKAISHNATQVSEDELTYTWNLMEVTSVELSFEDEAKATTKTASSSTTTQKAEKEKNSIMPMILIIALVAVAVVAIIIIIRGNKDNGAQ